MGVSALWLVDFRCFTETLLEPDPDGLTVLRGPNGGGKTSLLEGLGWLATQRSLRGSPREAMVRQGATRAVLRAQVTSGNRLVHIESEIPVSGPTRSWVNRQIVRKRRELGSALRVSVFSPEDLQLVQGGPSLRRQYLDEALLETHPRLEALILEVERILRQRAALLRQAAGRLTPETGSTLDVWDERLSDAGTRLSESREELTSRLQPLVTDAYVRLGGPSQTVGLTYRRSWSGDLAAVIAANRSQDLRRQSTGFGPHRDELEMYIGDRPARTHASQGEQRSMALSLRLALHLAADSVPEPPVLLLDDVFSELDPARSRALVDQLPPGQVLLTTATDPPDAIGPGRVVEVAGAALLGRNGR